MNELDLFVRIPHGIHLRVASEIVRRLKNYDAEVIISKDGVPARGDSILEIIMLAVTENSKVRVLAQGPDAHKAIEDMGEFFTDGAGI